MALKVIGAGFPRTASWSLKLALEQLGFGPCYHMTEALDHPEHWPMWEAAMRGEPVDFEVLFNGYASTTDTPGCQFYKELAELYPDAKVVLSVRGFDGWFASTQTTILSDEVMGFHGARGTLDMVNALDWGTNPKLRDRAYMQRLWDEHIAAVKRDIPPERLLVYEVGSGWEPLCRFLGVPVPGEPYPSVNSTEEFKGMIEQARAAGATASVKEIHGH